MDEKRTEKRWLRLILGLFIILGGMYALVTPVFEASDELWHYPMIRHLADGNPLPVQVFDPAQAGPWKQEASQPPLYYYLGAALTFWIDASDMETIRWENPHVDNGILTADGNINLTIHNPDWNPWQGTLLAVRLVRLFSVLLGAATVYLTYLISKELVPNRPEIALGAAALNAFTPMFLFISGAVNNDNLAIPLASLAILLMIRAVGKRYSVNGIRSSANGLRITDNRLPITDYWKTWLLIGTVIGLALLTKEAHLGCRWRWARFLLRIGRKGGTQSCTEEHRVTQRKARISGGRFCEFGVDGRFLSHLAHSCCFNCGLVVLAQYCAVRRFLGLERFHCRAGTAGASGLVGAAVERALGLYAFLLGLVWRRQRAHAAVDLSRVEWRGGCGGVGVCGLFGKGDWRLETGDWF
ncbi:MAG: glycosyltransferase family 39 protein [Ardenticatenaceae bacterium]|nr:glycosyltransferase family 39 protein [Ardenticatenaceae bacterium]